ncbi:hypothetical protein ACFL35_13665, partial [Candidatus Riflebacteria bacterium]
IVTLLKRACKFLQRPCKDESLKIIAELSSGDCRFALNYLECLDISLEKGQVIDQTNLKNLSPDKLLQYDKMGDYHYDLISALHKSMRGSDIQASLYWGARMLLGGEPPLYLFRRLLRFAMEDVGLADPDAVGRIMSLKECFHTLGEPEGLIAIYQAIVYLASSPKSNSIYKLEKKIASFLHNTTEHPVPFHIRNAPTKWAKELGMGAGYKYPHDFPYHHVQQNYMPEGVRLPDFYQPGAFGYEKEIKKRLEFWEKLNKK